MWFRRSTDGGATWSPRLDVSEAPRAPTTCSRRSSRVGTATCGSPGRTTATGSTPAVTTPTPAGTRITARRRTAAPPGRRRHSSPSSCPATRTSSRPMDGYLEPYGDYFELDVDGAGATHVLWGEAPSYAGPGQRLVRPRSLAAATKGSNSSDNAVSSLRVHSWLCQGQARQAGGHWFEPSTAHTESPR